MKKILKNVIFDNFQFPLNNPCPMFKYTSDEYKREITVVAPETIETLKLCITKLSLSYFLYVEREDFENKLKIYFECFNFNMSEFADCMLTYETKQKIAQNRRIVTEHLK